MHIDIVADDYTHYALHALGQSRFHAVEGWLSESLFTVESESHTPMKPAKSECKPVRYICIEAFSAHTDVQQIMSYLDTYREQTYQSTSGAVNCKMRIYKLFGSVC